MNGGMSDLIRHRLQRARETLDEAQLMAQSQHWNACVNRIYYACFYAVLALLAVHDLSSSKHSDVRSLFIRHFVKTDRFPKELGALYNELFERRQQGDYEDFYEADPDEARSWLEQAECFVKEIAALVKSDREG